MIDILRKRWVYHSLIWITCYLGLTALIYFDGRDETSLLDSLKEPAFFFIPIAFATYLGFWAKSRLFDQKKYLLYALAFLSIVMLSTFLYEYLDLLDGSLGNPRIQNISNFIFLQLFTVGLQYFKRGIINQYQIQELQAKTAQIELNALKAQINPHFLFNTLNNIYGINQINSEVGSEMIMELSDVMRYHLEFSKIGKVKLEDEIQLLQSYIKLEKLRLGESCKVNIKIDEVDDNLKISPLLFLPFIENAFKHGTHPTQNCYVDITLQATQKEVVFRVKNSVIKDRKVVKTNIGLKNTIRRLELIYPGKHELNISNTSDHYEVQLNIQL